MITPDAPFICHDGSKFWRVERCAMRAREHIIDRMAADIVTLAGETGQWGEVTSREIIGLGWSQMHLTLYGEAARGLAASRLRGAVMPLRELALAGAVFAVFVGLTQLTGLLSFWERLA